MISKRHIFTALRSLATLGLFAWLLQQVEWGMIASQLVDIKLAWLAAALLMPAFALALLGMRWAGVLRLLGLPTALSTVYKVTLAGQFFNSFLPGSTGGDIYKISAIWARHPEQRALAATSVIIDRLFAISALFCIAGFSFFANFSTWVPILSKYEIRIPQPSMLMFFVLILVVAVPALLLYFRVNLLPKAFVERLAVYMEAIRKSNIHSLRSVLGLGAASAVVHLIYFSGAFFLAKSIGLNITYLQILALMPLLMLAVLLPITINGHGIREAILISFFSVVGIHGQHASSGPEMAITFSLLYVSSDFLWCIPGGVVFLFFKPKALLKQP